MPAREAGNMAQLRSRTSSQTTTNTPVNRTTLQTEPINESRAAFDSWRGCPAAPVSMTPSAPRDAAAARGAFDVRDDAETETGKYASSFSIPGKLMRSWL